MKKLISAILAVFILQLAVCAQGVFDGGRISARAGETVTVGFSISENPGFVAYQMNLSYDKSVMTPQKVTKQMGNANLMYNLKEKGKVKIVYAAAQPTDQSGSLFTAEFKLSDKFADCKTAEITPQAVQFFSADGKKLDISVNTAIIDNAEPPVISDVSEPNGQAVSEKPGISAKPEVSSRAGIATGGTQKTNADTSKQTASAEAVFKSEITQSGSVSYSGESSPESGITSDGNSLQHGGEATEISSGDETVPEDFKRAQTSRRTNGFLFIPLGVIIAGIIIALIIRRRKK